MRLAAQEEWARRRIWRWVVTSNRNGSKTIVEENHPNIDETSGLNSQRRCSFSKAGVRRSHLVKVSRREAMVNGCSIRTVKRRNSSIVVCTDFGSGHDETWSSQDSVDRG